MAMDINHVQSIWSKNGKFKNTKLSDQPLGETLKYSAIGIDNTTPTIAALLVVFFQNFMSNPGQSSIDILSV